MKKFHIWNLGHFIADLGMGVFVFLIMFVGYYLDKKVTIDLAMFGSSYFRGAALAGAIGFIGLYVISLLSMNFSITKKKDVRPR